MAVKLIDSNFGKLRIIKIIGNKSLVKKLFSLGIYEGGEIEKKFSYKKGPVIVKVLNSTVALGKNMAEKIIVEEEK
ncbi:MAG: FeoA domain-containing protein [Elusimicrobiales bacterium]|nr:FeoA domain-containing protein [Elusimicrobiales bacterium]